MPRMLSRRSFLQDTVMISAGVFMERVGKTVPGGHISLFVGARMLPDQWPSIAEWIAG
jgi:hypothetical protein